MQKDESIGTRTHHLQEEYDASGGGDGRGNPPRRTALDYEPPEPEPCTPLDPFGPIILSYTNNGFSPPIALAQLAHLKRTINRTWFPPGGKKRKVVINLSIEPSGIVTAVELVNQSGSIANGEAVFSAVKRVSNRKTFFLSPGRTESVKIVVTFYWPDIQIDLADCHQLQQIIPVKN
jgi:hypothetical protein